MYSIWTQIPKPAWEGPNKSFVSVIVMLLLCVWYTGEYFAGRIMQQDNRQYCQ